MRTETAGLPPRGLRPVTEARVRASRLAEIYAGLPDGATKWDLVRHLEAVPPARLGLLPRQRGLLILLVRLQAEEFWKSRSWLAAHGDAFSCNDLVCVASNGELALQMGIAERQVARHLAALADAGWVAFRDSATRKRWRSRPSKGGVILEAYGIDLRPLAAQFEHLAELAGVAEQDRRYLRNARYAISGLLNTLAGLGANLALQGCLDDVIEARRLGERARKWSDADKVWSAHGELIERVRALEDRLLEATQALEEVEEYSGAPVDIASQRTDSPETRSEEIEDSAWREGGAAGPEISFGREGEAGQSEDVEAGSEPEIPAFVRAPSPSQVLKTLPAILAKHQIPFSAPAALGSPRNIVEAYGRQALAKLGRDRFDEDWTKPVKEVFGEYAFALLCMLAAYDEKVREKRAWMSAMAQRAALYRADPNRGDLRIEMARSWYGLWRRCLNETVH